VVGDEVARLFVAVPLTEEARGDIAHLVARAAPRGLPGRPAHPDKWHVTLRFLGDVDEVGRDRLLAELDGAGLGTPFRVRWGGLGAFPNLRRATVLWVGLDEGAPQLTALANAVEEAVEAAGFPPEDRPFRPHLTLSRIRPHQDVTALVENSPPLGVPMPVDRVVVYRSHLGGRGGPRYEVVEEFPLA
jgi:2'-5' RNA ligase